MSNYWFKLKGLVISILIFFMSNAYLVYILSKYVNDKTTGYLIVFTSNEIFIFLAVLYYIVYDLKLRLRDNLEEIRYILKKK